MDQHVLEAPAPTTAAAPAPVGAPRKGAGLAITGLLVAGAALLFSPLPIINNVAPVLAVVALLFAVPAYLGARKGTRRGKGMAAAGIVVSVLAVVVTLATQALYVQAVDEVATEVGTSLDQASGEATDQVLAEHLQVDLGTPAYDGYFATTVPATLTNTGETTQTFSVHLEALDAQGARVADTYVFADALAAGQVAAQEATFTADVTAATIRVVEVSMV